MATSDILATLTFIAVTDPELKVSVQSVKVANEYNKQHQQENDADFDEDMHSGFTTPRGGRSKVKLHAW